MSQLQSHTVLVLVFSTMHAFETLMRELCSLFIGRVRRRGGGARRRRHLWTRIRARRRSSSVRPPPPCPHAELLAAERSCQTRLFAQHSFWSLAPRLKHMHEGRHA